MTDAKVPVLPEGVERALQDGVMNINTLYRNKALNADEAASLRGDWLRARRAIVAALKRAEADGIRFGVVGGRDPDGPTRMERIEELRAEADAMEAENG